jgi:Ca2+-binding RTX toxin-like protein
LGSATTFENVIGGGLADTLTGNAASNRLAGRAGADTLTGAGGNDIFEYASLSDSLLANYDVITDYSIGDILDRPGASTATLNVSTGTAAGLSSAQVGSILNTFSFASSSSVAFRAVGFSGTFVAFNDAIAGFNPNNDAIVHLISYNISSTNTISIA